MTHSPSLRLALLCLSLLAVSATQAQNMSKPDYKAGKTRISETYAADKAACQSQSGNAKDVCKEEAKGKEKAKTTEDNNFVGIDSDEEIVLMEDSEVPGKLTNC